MNFRMKFHLKLGSSGALILAITSQAALADMGDLVKIYEYTGKYLLTEVPSSAKSIVLEVPQKYRYGGSRGVSRAWGVNILTYYPGFSSSNDPENAGAGLNCAGYCNGRILVSIENRARSINNTRWLNSPNMADIVGRLAPELDIHAKGNSTIAVGPEHGFDKGYEITIPPHGALKSEVRLYLFHISEDHVHYDVTAQCLRNQFADTCVLHFSLHCNPAVYVQVVGIDMRFIDNLLEIKDKADRFVSSMIREPACIG